VFGYRLSLLEPKGSRKETCLETDSEITTNSGVGRLPKGNSP